MSIEHISDTALWAAAYRAMETERSRPLFRDPFARALAGSKGMKIVETIPGGKSAAWAPIVRTAVMDELVLDAVKDRNVDTVLNLGAGLDTRPFRLALPSGLRWIEVDLAPMIDYKLDKLAGAEPRCELEQVKLDLREAGPRRDLFAGLNREGNRILVLAEGLLMYLEPSMVSSLAEDLRAQSRFHWWLMDYISPFSQWYIQLRCGRTLENGNSRMRFAPNSITGFFRAHGWRTLENRSTVDEARRLGRQMPYAWLWSLASPFLLPFQQEICRELLGVALLEKEIR